ASLRAFFEAHYFSLAELPEDAPGEFTLVDIDLRVPEQCNDLKAWLKSRPRNAQVIFSILKGSHAQAVQAYALGATALLARPVSGEEVRAKFFEQSLIQRDS